MASGEANQRGRARLRRLYQSEIGCSLSCLMRPSAKRGMSETACGAYLSMRLLIAAVDFDISASMSVFAACAAEAAYARISHASLARCWRVPVMATAEHGVTTLPLSVDESGFGCRRRHGDDSAVRSMR